ncbi:MAG TPA: SDR family NAD(P)-dependent oxidoreductase [Marmoricola sp.]|nr:SDR family NAD(P)-dependent oxidoreductase [Marmoricola sp.]
MRALVTGGSSGLGAALVRALVARGDQVLIADLSEPAEGVPADFVRLDVRSAEDWDAAREWVEQHWGGLDLLINNAGVGGGGRIDVTSLDEWQWITEINLFGVVRGVREFVSMMKAQRSGHIVNVASLAGFVHPAGMSSYNAVKAGVVALTETLGHELAQWRIKATVVCPSFFKTNLVDSMRSSDPVAGKVVGSLVERSATTADQIAAAVLAGVERGDQVIFPDPASQAAIELKRTDAASYDAVMRHQARRLEEAAGG